MGLNMAGTRLAPAADSSPRASGPAAQGPISLTRQHMVKLAATFRGHFSQWDTTLPAQHVENRAAGSIHQAGWTIRCHFGIQDGREYLEYFASHRMTNDRLERIYEDGTSETLDVCREFYSPQDPEGETKLIVHDREFYKKVKDLGLM